MEPVEHVLFEGTQTGIPVGRLEREESRVVCIPVCFLSFGRFILSAVVRSSKTNTREGVGQLTAIVVND